MIRHYGPCLLGRPSKGFNLGLFLDTVLSESSKLCMVILITSIQLFKYRNRKQYFCGQISSHMGVGNSNTGSSVFSVSFYPISSNFVLLFHILTRSCTKYSSTFCVFGLD